MVLRVFALAAAVVLTVNQFSAAPDCIRNWLRQLRGVAAGSCVRSTEEQHIGADYALPSQDVDRRLYLWHARDREPVGHPEQQDLEANHVFAGR
jgi:hypothetical protein